MSFYGLNWFKVITGVNESKFRTNISEHFETIDDKIYLINNDKKYDCGKLNIVRLGDLRKQLSKPQHSEKAKFKIVYSDKFEDYEVSNVQFSHPNSVFLVASNFNAIEGLSSKSTVNNPNLLTNYYKDHTQGPAACLGCPAATIYRTLTQPNLNMLENFKCYNIKNGYPHLTKPTEELNSDDYISIYQSDAEVNLIQECEDTYKLVNGGKITQVFGAAVNMHQGIAGKANAEVCSKYPELASMPLECAYETAYLVTILENKETLQLCLLGGGVFNNPIKDIYTAILKIHEKYQHYGNFTVELRLFGNQTPGKITMLKNLLTSINSNVDIEFCKL